MWIYLCSNYNNYINHFHEKVGAVSSFNGGVTSKQGNRHFYYIVMVIIFNPSDLLIPVEIFKAENIENDAVTSWG